MFYYLKGSWYTYHVCTYPCSYPGRCPSVRQVSYESVQSPTDWRKNFRVYNIRMDIGAQHGYRSTSTYAFIRFVNLFLEKYTACQSWAARSINGSCCSYRMRRHLVALVAQTFVVVGWRVGLVIPLYQDVRPIISETLCI